MKWDFWTNDISQWAGLPMKSDFANLVIFAPPGQDKCSCDIRICVLCHFSG